MLQGGSSRLQPSHSLESKWRGSSVGSDSNHQPLQFASCNCVPIISPVKVHFVCFLTRKQLVQHNSYSPYFKAANYIFSHKGAVQAKLFSFFNAYTSSGVHIVTNLPEALFYLCLTGVWDSLSLELVPSMLCTWAGHPLWRLKARFTPVSPSSELVGSHWWTLMTV